MVYEMVILYKKLVKQTNLQIKRLVGRQSDLNYLLNLRGGIIKISNQGRITK